MRQESLKQNQKVLFFQHSNHNGGAPRSLKQIVRAYEEEFGAQKVLFIRPGPVLKTYGDVHSEVICGKVILPFHGSEVSGMNWKVAFRNILGFFTVPGTYYKYVKGVDVLYLNSSSLCMHGLAARLLGSSSLTIIYHIREPLLSGFWGNIIRWAIKNSANSVLAISKNELTNLELPEIKGEVVYNYVHSNEYKPNKGESLHRTDSSINDGAIAVGYFARLDQKNGIEDFLEIASKFEGDNRIVFCIYGYTGHENSTVKALLDNLAANIRVYPMVDNVPQHLVDLDLLLVPFKVPHFSRSVIEAAMLGVPSIVYDIVSVNETVLDGQTGYVVPLNDMQAMADRINILVGDPGLKKIMGERAHQFAMDNFSELNYQRIKAVINEDD